MKTIKFFILSLVLVLLGATSCIYDTIEGNGIRASEGRVITAFDKVKSSGEFEIHITNGDTYEVIVSAEENIISYIETQVSNGTLSIDTEEHTKIRNDLPMEVFITLPELEAIKLSGSGTITTDYFICDKMELTVSGSGKITTACDAREVKASVSGSGTIRISGTADNADYRISGSGNIKASDLSINKCKTAISGSGDMWVAVDQSLNAHISGSGNVYYYGDPNIETHISGSGNVIDFN